jgi:hypothetical protein
VVRFIEDNWLGGARIGTDTNDNWAGTLDNMFNFSNPKGGQYQLDPTTGETKSSGQNNQGQNN